MTRSIFLEIDANITLGAYEMIRDQVAAIMKTKATIEQKLSHKTLTDLRLLARKIKVKYYTSLSRFDLTKSIAEKLREKSHVLTLEKIIG